MIVEAKIFIDSYAPIYDGCIDLAEVFGIRLDQRTVRTYDANQMASDTDVTVAFCTGKHDGMVAVVYDDAFKAAWQRHVKLRSMRDKIVLTVPPSIQRDPGYEP